MSYTCFQVLCGVNFHANGMLEKDILLSNRMFQFPLLANCFDFIKFFSIPCKLVVRYVGVIRFRYIIWQEYF